MDKVFYWLPQLRRTDLTRLCIVQYSVGAHLDRETNENEIPKYCEMVVFVSPTSASKIMEQSQLHVIVLESENRRSIVPSLSFFLSMASSYLPESVVIQFVLQKTIQEEIAPVISLLRTGLVAIFEDPSAFGIRNLYMSKTEREAQIHRVMQDRIDRYTDIVRNKSKVIPFSIEQIQRICVDHNFARPGDQQNITSTLQDLVDRKFVVLADSLYYLNDPMKGKDSQIFIPAARSSAILNQGNASETSQSPEIISYTSDTPSTFHSSRYGYVDICNGINILNNIIQENFMLPVSWQESLFKDSATADPYLRFEASLHLPCDITRVNAKFIGRAQTKKLARKEACYLCCHELFSRGLIK